MAPEICPRLLQGKVYGDSEHSDGTHLVTAEVRNVKGCIATTSDGLVYRLGEVDKGYRDFMRDNNIDFDPENPIRMVKS